MKHSQRKHLLLGTSFLALSILSFPAQGLAATCTGSQDAQCLNHKGLPVADSFCLPDTTGTKAGAKPAPLAGCTYNCPPPPTYHGSSGDGGGGTEHIVNGHLVIMGSNGEISIHGSPDGRQETLDQVNNNIANGNPWSTGGSGDGDGDGDGCFVTTAVVDVMGEADNGPTLTTLRHLRDNYTAQHRRGTERINIYYHIAPMIVDTINGLKDSEDIWKSIHKKWIDPVAQLVEAGSLKKADEMYADMTFYLTYKYLMDGLSNEQKRKLFLNTFRIYSA